MLQSHASTPRRPAFRFNFRSKQHVIGALVTIFILFQIFNFRQGSLGWNPWLGWKGSQLHVLRPGDYLEPPTSHEVPDHSQEVLPDEILVGSTHDKRNDQFYLGGTLTLTSQTDAQQAHPSPYIYDPYPEYNSNAWHRTWEGEFRPCLGPNNEYLDRTRADHMVHVYKGKQKNFPTPSFGSYEAMGLDGNVCTDRYGRYGAYGHKVPGYNGPMPVWDEVKWGDLQRKCFERNANRYLPEQEPEAAKQGRFPLTPPSPGENVRSNRTQSSDSKPRKHARNAVLIRGWHSMSWTSNDYTYLRSLIMELSLHSGAEYEVFLMVHVLDDSIPLETDVDIQRLKATTIPDEFHDMTIFFNNKMLENWYPKIFEHKAIFQHFQPVQIFSQVFSDFDYYWQFEMDSRNFGHMYHFLDKAADFAKEQPRKHLWERSAYFYIPDFHGTWSAFSDMVKLKLVGRDTVWGPIPAQGIQPVGPTPPVRNPEDDDFKWGVGEEADLITFLPIFDPENSKWGFRDIIYNMPQGRETPRRTSVITMSRLSRNLLNLMHDSLAIDGQAVVSEMSPATWALIHGLKAVHVPHPLYTDGQWTPKELDKIYNRGPPEKISGTTDTVWEYSIVNRIMYRISFMYSSQTSEDLYRRWLGYKPSITQYTDGTPHQDAEGLWWFDGGLLREDLYGQLCFPPIFVHPVKNTDEALSPSRPVHGFSD